MTTVTIYLEDDIVEWTVTSQLSIREQQLFLDSFDSKTWNLFLKSMQEAVDIDAHGCASLLKLVRQIGRIVGKLPPCQLQGPRYFESHLHEKKEVELFRHHVPLTSKVLDALLFDEQFVETLEAVGDYCFDVMLEKTTKNKDLFRCLTKALGQKQYNFRSLEDANFFIV